MNEKKCNIDKNFLYDTDIEKKMHFNNIQNICYKFNEDSEQVTKIYEHILERLKKQAKIKDYLSVLVARKVQKIIKIKHKIKKV